MILPTLTSLFVLAAFAAPAASCRADGEPATVVLRCRDHAPIRGTEILVRDLADVVCDDAELAARVAELRFAARPSQGFARVFAKRDVLGTLALAGIPPGQVQLTGADEIVAQPLTTLLKPSDLAAVAEPVLRAAVERDDRAADVELELTTPLGAMRCPPGRRDMHLRAALVEGRLSPTSGAVEVAVVVDGEVWRTQRLNYRLRRFAEALVTTGPIQRGVPLDFGNLELVRVRVRPGDDHSLRDHAVVAGMVARRDLPRGHVVTARDCGRPAVVFDGDPVTIVMRRGRVEVAARGVALGQGAAGDRIQVRRAGTNRQLQAVIHGPSLVVVTN